MTGRSEAQEACPQKVSQNKSAEPPHAEQRSTRWSDLLLGRSCSWRAERPALPLMAVPSLVHMDLWTFENPVKYLFFPRFTHEVGEVGVMVQSHTLKQTSGSGFGALPLFCIEPEGQPHLRSEFMCGSQVSSGHMWAALGTRTSLILP